MPSRHVSSLYEPVNEVWPFAPRVAVVGGPFEYAPMLGRVFS